MFLLFLLIEYCSTASRVYARLLQCTYLRVLFKNCFFIDWHFPDDVVSASLSISIGSGALVLRTCRLAHLSVCPESVLWQNG